MSTVTWTQDANGNYEVSSPEHLKQLMHKGGLYTDGGLPPSGYWAAGTSYIQTADIDLLGDSTDITPIGVNNDEFFGNYDGAEFKISNWSYVDPDFTGTSQNELYVGLFGYIADCVLQNIRLDGVWTLQGFGTSAAFLVGYSYDTQAGTTTLANIECDFSVGTFVDRRETGGTYVAGIIGRARDAMALTGLTVKGSIDFRANTHGVEDTGGIGGHVDSLTGDATLFQNVATFPSGIVSTRRAGGIVGNFSTTGTTPSRWINAMVGDLSGGQNVGGVVGYAIFGGAGCDTFVNAMTGDIIFDPASYSTRYGGGGVISYIQALSGPASKLFNYMNGNMTKTGSGFVAGIIGIVDDDPGSELNDCINAMNGSVSSSIIGDQLRSDLVVSGVESNTSFGLSFANTDAYGTSSPSGLLTNVDFPDLPYAALDGTDALGNTYEFDFVFANLSGNSSYADNTHLILHKGDVSTPFNVSFDIDPGSTTVFLTFANLTTTTVTPSVGLVVLSSDSGVTIIVPTPAFTADPRPTNIPVTITEVSGAIGYQITYEGPTGGEITAVSGETTLEHNITGLDPDTAYTVRLYVDTGAGYVLTEESTTATLSNVATNYNKQDFEDGGFFNLLSLAKDSLSSLAAVWNGVFGTGDVVGVPVSNASEFRGAFINLGDTLSIKEISGVVLPFEAASGTGQDVSVTLSDDATTVPITYDESVNTITVDGIVYYPGDSFVLDGNKVTVLDV